MSDFSSIFIFIIMALVIVMFSAMMVYIGDTTYTKLKEVADDIVIGDGSTNVSEIVDDTIGVVNTNFNALRWISVFLIIGMILAIIMGSYLVTTKPVYFIPYFFVVIISIFVGAGISNGYETIIAQPTLSSSFNEFAGANWFMLRLPMICAIVGMIGGVVMYISWRAGRGYSPESYYYG